jgi:hypothetical protein
MVSAEQRWKRGSIAHARTVAAFHQAAHRLNNARFRAHQHPNNAQAQANLVRARANRERAWANYTAATNMVSSAYRILLRKYHIPGIRAANQNAVMETLYQRNLPRAKESAARKIQSAFRRFRAIRHTRARAPANLVLQKAMSPTRIGHLIRTYGPNSIRHFR